MEKILQSIRESLTEIEKNGKATPQELMEVMEEFADDLHGVVETMSQAA